ncbi:MAG: 1,4-dihydroxy-2-naphthoate polyprenyltransferase [Dehalococcoidia bacterium]|nr:MAG: 1,4-dihydroxy-2-naphthoate polyprenyltransferase [Dehalococcoidia bacterium]
MAVRTDSVRPGIVSTWLLAARPATLWAAVVPVVVGTAAAQRDGDFRLAVFVMALVASLLLQIGTNLANDVFDFERGADTGERLGPPRVTQTGLLSPGDVRRGMLATFGAAAVLGLGLAYYGGWPIIVVGALAIVAGVVYTGGPWPTGYHGLGDAFVFCFFGLVAVAGTYYLHTDTLSWRAIAAAVPVGFLITAILVVNNLRDIETDARTGKRTLAVRLGGRPTRAEYAALVVGAYAVVVAMAAVWSWWLLLPLLSAPAAARVAAPVLGGARAGALNIALKRTSQLQLLFGLLLALGFLL